jgi:exosortase A-associated hydrolase 1
MNFDEQACAFDCCGNRLIGVLSLPEQPQARGVLMLVGGPQYRAGSHRQFTLLARMLAAHGIPVMRFDYRGMGDSDGEQRAFDNIDDDIRCAIDRFMLGVPGMGEVAIWGLCDAASAALFYAYRDSRVTGLALLNPWVRTEEGLAKTHLRHYYLARLFDPQLRRKILRGEFDAIAASKSLLTAIRAVFFKRAKTASTLPTTALSLPDRMLDGYRRFNGKVLLILSGNDFTAKEFSDLAAASGQWRKLLADRRTQRRELPGANHTFSTQAWRQQVGDWTVEWVKSW